MASFTYVTCKIEGFCSSFLQFHKKFDVQPLLSFCSKHDCRQVKIRLQISIIWHYINLMGRGLTRDWEEIQQ